MRINTSGTIVLPAITCYFDKNFISAVMLFKHRLISLLFDKIYQILIEFGHCSWKIFILNIIKRLIIATTFVLINKTMKNIVSFVMRFFQVILQCVSYMRLKITRIALVYSITVKFNCILFITDCIFFNGSNLIIQSNITYI